MSKKTEDEVKEELERKQKEKERAEELRKAHQFEEKKNASGNKNTGE